MLRRPSEVAALTGEVGSGTQVTDYPANQELLRVGKFRYEDVVDGALTDHASELRSEFFHCRIFADNFTSLSTVQRDLCGN